MTRARCRARVKVRVHLLLGSGSVLEFGLRLGLRL
jgi:hypothetical protein